MLTNTRVLEWVDEFGFLLDEHAHDEFPRAIASAAYDQGRQDVIAEIAAGIKDHGMPQMDHVWLDKKVWQSL